MYSTNVTDGGQFPLQHLSIFLPSIMLVYCYFIFKERKYFCRIETIHPQSLVQNCLDWSVSKFKTFDFRKYGIYSDINPLVVCGATSVMLIFLQLNKWTFMLSTV